MNRQNRRHPTHPLLPIQYPSKKRILDKPSKKAFSVSKIKQHLRRRGNWKPSKSSTFMVELFYFIKFTLYLLFYYINKTFIIISYLSFSSSLDIGLSFS